MIEDEKLSVLDANISYSGAVVRDHKIAAVYSASHIDLGRLGGDERLQRWASLIQYFVFRNGTISLNSFCVHEPRDQGKINSNDLFYLSSFTAIVFPLADTWDPTCFNNVRVGLP
jgi:hypothetical protein